METRHWIILSAILALVVLGGGICVCGGFGLLMASAPEGEMVDLTATNEGTTAGAHGTTELCITTTHERTLQCGAVDFDCTLRAQDYGAACLRAVPTPTPGICDGVPEQSALGDWDFADTLCRQRGWPSDTGQCDPIADAISVYCHPS